MGEAPHRHTHACIHGKLGSPAGAARLAPLQPHAAALPPEKAASIDGIASASSHTAAPPSHHPLRILISADALSSDAGLSCFAPGDRHAGFLGSSESSVCGSGDVVTASKRLMLLDTLMPRATAAFSKLLSVRRQPGRLVLRSTRCGYGGGVLVPEAHRTVGVDADLIIYLTARPIDVGGDTIAYSGHCEQEAGGRPVAAHFNWSPRHLADAPDEWTVDYLVRVAMHEMTHALVFSESLLGHFPYGPGGGALTRVRTPGGGEATAIRSPHVLRAARAQFGCASLEGAQLEDGGGVGTDNCHWEMRWFRDEYMTGAASPGERVISAVSLALFADSGWYEVAAAEAEPLAWGRGAGCAFVEGTCAEWGDGVRCERLEQEACSHEHLAKAYCDLQRYSGALPEPMRYFDSSSALGGYSALLDYCPVYRAYSNGHCTQAQPSYSEYGEEFCETCRCVVSQPAGTPAASPPPPSIAAAAGGTGSGGSGAGGVVGGRPECHRTRCLDSDTLEIRLDAQWRRCPPEGGVVAARRGVGPVELWARQWVCPPAREVCGLAAEYWPRLSSLAPTRGSVRGGVALTLLGSGFDSMAPPLRLALGLRDGTELTAANLSVLNATCVTATLPPMPGATSFAWADVALSDAHGRTAFLYSAFLYLPGWQPYAVTAAILALVVLMAAWVVPAYLRSGCEPKEKRANRELV